MADPVREAALVPGCPEHVALWDAINAYSAACGGHPTRGGGARMDAVVRVEAALRAALAATDGATGGANDAEAMREACLRALKPLWDTYSRLMIDYPPGYPEVRWDSEHDRRIVESCMTEIRALPLPPASAGEVETARRARRLAQDAVIRALNAVGVRASNADDFAEIVGSSVDAAERAATSGDHPSAARRGHEGEARGGAS